MKKAILVRVIAILAAALLISSVISYYFVAHELLVNNRNSMTKMIRIVDYGLDYSKNLEEQLQQMYDKALGKEVRITIIREDGEVVADTEILSGTEIGFENHLGRKEIKMALETGNGYATRYSDTLHKDMLYVASMSGEEGYIIRLAIPYHGVHGYLQEILPIMLLATLIAFAISIFVTYRFANSVTRPLKEISDELKKVNRNELDFEFKQYKYDELNVISQSSMKLSEEVREHIDRLEFQKKIKQEFFSNASHELKTPITSVKGYAELIDQGFVKDQETRLDFMKRIIKETDNMTNLINDILMISQLETNEAEVTYSMVRMPVLLEEIFESVEPIAKDYQVSLHKECGQVTIEASTKQLRELLVNLITNGIKYNHPGGNVWVHICEKNEQLMIEIKDDGTGIAPKDKERIFERFFRVDKGRSKKMGGTGLGLSIVKHIIEFYKGSIEVESELGKGSVFKISIPMKRDAEQLSKNVGYATGS